MGQPGLIRIEPAIERDMPMILESVRALAEYEKHLDRVGGSEERIRKTMFGPEPAAQVLFAYENEAAVGFAMFFYIYSTFVGLRGLHFEDLFVKPKAREKGVGRALLWFLAKLAKEKNCWRIEWAVLHWNESAIHFYKGLGAIRMEEWDVYRLSGRELNQLASGVTFVHAPVFSSV